MKKLLYFVSVLILALGCNRGNIHHTYYGDIDVDTVRDIFRDYDSTVYYLVDIQTRPCAIVYPTDTVCWEDTTWHYYNPEKDCYCYTFKDKYGNYVILEYNPYEEKIN